MARQTYEAQTWENLPNETTPINAERLVHIEQGIKDAMDNSALKEIYSDDSINLGRKAGSYIGTKSATAGLDNTATGSYSTLLGEQNVTAGRASFGAGKNNKINGDYGISLGKDNSADGECITLGRSNTATGGGITIGYNLITAGYNQIVLGNNNSDDVTNNTDKVLIVGSGTPSVKKNIFTLDWQGNAHFAGDITNDAGVTLNGLKTLLDSIQSSYMTYEETTTALNSQETGEINKIPNIYAIRDWCKTLLNPAEGA